MRAAALLLAAAALHGGDPERIREAYAKREHAIPMRDGVRLHTAVYVPRRAGGPWPILLERTPYGAGPYGPDAFPGELGPSAALERSGFIFVVQDVRGRRMSGGEWVEARPLEGGAGVDEATDAWDTVAWLLEHVPGNNGRVGIWGISYPGFYAAAALAGPHPAVKAVSPQAPMVDLWEGDDDHHNGALFLAQAFWFHTGFGRPRPGPSPSDPEGPDLRPAHGDAYRFFLELGSLARADAAFLGGEVPSWKDLLDHPDRDAYWSRRDLRPHIHAPAPAVLTVGGWFDAEDLFGPLRLDRILGPGRRTLAMGPWPHGGWRRAPGRSLGALDFGSDTARTFQERVEAPFFLHHLKGAPDPGLPRAWAFRTGANTWHAFEAWPPPGAAERPLYLREAGALSWDPPRAPGSDTFVSDPDHPVPYTGGTELDVSPGFMAGDQRFAAWRPDVLTYATPPLEADLTVAGPVRVHLQTSTTGTDGDWVVKIIDRHPAGIGPLAGTEDPFGDAAHGLDGLLQLVRGDVLRGRYRRDPARPEPFVPGRTELLAFTLNDVFHTFRKGHRLVVQVQGSWFPLVDRNPQTFVDIPRARPEDFRPAEVTLHRDPDRASWIGLPILRVP
ncbi:MAG TPA: CocE/NonD family hydrolase [Holophaga sp.]|nr:CocE/NonD family hydrolase [Holophaga sp.]